jgi:hypothetical protein
MVYRESNQSVPVSLLTLLLIYLAQRNVLSSLYMTVTPCPLGKIGYCLAQASLFFILSVRRGFWAGILHGILSFSLMRWLKCFSKAVANSGICLLDVAGGCIGIFHDKPLSTFKARLVMIEGHPEPIFLSGMVQSGSSLAFARRHLMEEQWWPRQSAIAMAYIRPLARTVFLLCQPKKTF